MNILMLLKTYNLRFDDRVRKQCLSLKSEDKEVSIVSLQNEDTIGGGRTNYGIPYKSLKLFTRDFFKKEKGLILKTLELYYKMLLEVVRQKPKTVWVHNFELAGVIPVLFLFKKIGIINKVIWDQHEYIDHSVKVNNLTKAIYKSIERMSDVIISCNKERIDALQEDKMIVNREKYIILNNFPDKQFVNEEKKALPTILTKWLENTPYLLAQGGASPDRYLENIVKSILKVKKYKLLIIGPFDKKGKKSLENKYGEDFKKWVNFWGGVPQMEMIKYIDHAAASIIFYKNKDLNHWLCAPNRLYQALGRGIPVIVGNNPPLKNAVAKCSCGISIDSDGENVPQIIEAIRRFSNNSSIYRENAKSCREQYLWEKQFKNSQVRRLLYDDRS